MAGFLWLTPRWGIEKLLTIPQLGEVIPSWNGDGVITGRESHASQRTMSKKIYRVSEGAQLAGVCAGLQARGNGPVFMWRLIFFFGSWFSFVGLITCIYLAYSWPKTKTIEDAQRMDIIMSEDIEDVSNLDDLESRIKRLIAMMPQGLINDDEFAKLRKKELVPD